MSYTELCFRYSLSMHMLNYRPPTFLFCSQVLLTLLWSQSTDQIEIVLHILWPSWLLACEILRFLLSYKIQIVVRSYPEEMFIGKWKKKFHFHFDIKNFNYWEFDCTSHEQVSFGNMICKLWIRKRIQKLFSCCFKVCKYFCAWFFAQLHEFHISMQAIKQSDNVRRITTKSESLEKYCPHFWNVEKQN